MDAPLIDFSYLEEISQGDDKYMFEVITLFLDTVPKSLETLDQLIQETNDFDSIQRRAHSLKSSSNVIKVRRMFDNVAKIDVLAREKTGKEEMVTRMADVLANFNEAMPLIKAERKKHKQGK